ncbi:hypothetical protein H9L10_13495 [Phycicoccus endophyticus]|uniref:Uncharacterized protein n=1 Tax=Phycicoccus endophyticus TaxID=1690220 RepID=A0A7G9R0U7_9MICO|nr:hypothetical protein [Phycicoccus endophyticus]NHI19513.1 hypothetical protein [Phycicoccus endophyticus]QNN49222.1 hypothetical protein H9L10_13495 [Phycicoccus endophyticus]GGL39778.1 hypothetical protein GCM10012283_22840 [Phycicoccus endophyticus]
MSCPWPRTSPALAASALVLLAACASEPTEPLLYADSMGGASFPIMEAEGSPMVWVSSTDGSDPRPGGAPDPGMCQVSGGGSPQLTDPDHGDSRLGDTVLYAVAQIEGLEPPGEITCSGDAVKHVYVGRP